MTRLSSFAAGEWVEGSGAGRGIVHAVTGEQLYEVSSEGLPFSEMLSYARTVGGPNLRAMTFHERALMLKALAQHLNVHKDELYRLSAASGATKIDCWIDIDGGIGTLFTYASKGRRELPNQRFHIEGALERLSRENTFVGQHICVPLEGAALHINAFNFPCWGMLEKLAPTFLAGVPAIVKPATSTCYVAREAVRLMLDSGLLPEGALQLICGSAGDLFDHLTCQDVVTFTGSKDTALSLRAHPRLLSESVRFNQETDSLNSAVLAPDAEPGTAEFDLFIKEVLKEMTVKAGQKCTVIRRVIVPRVLEQAVIEALGRGIAETKVGNPALKEVRMGPLVSKEQASDVGRQVEKLRAKSELVAGGEEGFEVLGAEKEKGGFFPHTLLYCNAPFSAPEVHEVEAFGPVSTVFGYQSLDEAITLANLGQGSLCASVFTADDETARRLTLGIAPFHGRLLLMNEQCAKESTGHGSPLPHLVHGGPGRAGGGEELGGIRAVLHYMQRTALQGTPERLTRICDRYMSGASVRVDRVHPFRKYFEELEIGESLLTHRRTVTEADVVNFAALSGDHFYAHVDAVAARESLFKDRVAHGYFVISAAAGLFVDPAPGPVLANYGLDNLRFIRPVYIGDTLQVRLTCKEKTPKDNEPHGVVAWEVEVLNQTGDAVAVYTILTLVARLAH